MQRDPRKTILIVEDESVVAMHLAQSLRGLGYEVVGTAASAEEAIRCTSERIPDLVLMDIRIAGEKDGIETAEALRARFDVPVVYLTAYADGETVRRATRTEGYGYLVKPFRPEELHATVEMSLYKHQLDRQHIWY